MRKKTIENAATAVRQALTEHDARKLKEANNGLDEATQQLAAAIVEKAMRGT